MSIAQRILAFFEPVEAFPNDRELADLGLSRQDYQQLVSSATGARERMEALAAHFGVTPEMLDAERGTVLEIAETCGHCEHTGQCQRALEGRGTFDPELCPNAARYKEMAADQSEF